MAKLFQFFIFCVFQTYSISLNMSIVYAFQSCPPEQALSLLKLKDTLDIDTYKERCDKVIGMGYYVRLSSYCDRDNIPIMEPKISSWNRSTDCCIWEGVTCDEFTGNVIELDLSGNRLVGVIDSNSSIFQLSYLKKLSLAYNYLYGSEISSTFRRLTHLTHLNLTSSGVRGKVPSEVSQLQDLVSLDLSYNYGLILEPYVVKVLLQNLTRLRVLSLQSVSISSSLPNNLSSSLTVIDLGFTNLKGTFPNHLFHLPNLQQLSLAGNSFDDFSSLASIKWNTTSPLQKLELDYIEFPKKLLDTIGNLKHLTYLNLSDCNLNGTLPQSFGNLTQLNLLDLSSNQFSQIPPAILGLEHLTYLDIGSNHLDTAILPSAFSNLKNLKFLYLQGNKLTTPSVSLFLRNLTQIEAIDLRDNSLYEIPPELFELSLLRLMDLSNNKLQGPIPKSFSNLVNLEHLNLASNNLSGHIEIDAISNFLNLTTFDISSNNFSGTVDVKFLRRLKWINVLDLSSNSLTVTNENNTTWPVVSIDYLLLASCNIRDLDVLRSIVVRSVVHLPNSNIHGEIPEWVLSSWSNVTLIDLSSNYITNIGSITQLQSLQSLNLRSNLLQGELPDLPQSIQNLILSNNYITHIGSITQLQSVDTLDLRSNLLQGELPALPQSIQELYLSNNHFHGEIKPSICNLIFLNVLDLSNNNFYGAFPHCFDMMDLYILDLHMNNLTGTIPNTFSMDSPLFSLNLRGNHLEGEVPRSLISCSYLQVIDLSENNLSAIFPTWLGDLPNLRVLSLRSNKFYGPVSSFMLPNKDNSTFAFPQLQILDLSYNQLSGRLPASLFHRFRQMMNEAEPGSDRDYLEQSFATSVYSSTVYSSTTVDYYDSMTIVINGNIMEVDKILREMSIIDLSSNHFEGHIPDSIGGLVVIRHLNLSHNSFTGQIPPFLGNLSKLLSLDLSFNQLHGNIPDQLAALGFLSVMNLSYNHLTGLIPTGQQLRTFQNNSYIGNDGLCGYPLSRNCGNDSPRVVISDEEDDQEFIDGFTWQSVLVGYGVGVCVGLVLGSIMLFTEKPKWLIRTVEEEAHKVLYKYKARNGIYEKWFRES